MAESNGRRDNRCSQPAENFLNVPMPQALSLVFPLDRRPQSWAEELDLNAAARGNAAPLTAALANNRMARKVRDV